MPPTSTKPKGPVPLKTRLQDAWDLGLKNAAWVVPIVGALLIYLLYTWASSVRSSR